MNHIVDERIATFAVVSTAIPFKTSLAVSKAESLIEFAKIVVIFADRKA